MTLDFQNGFDITKGYSSGGASGNIGNGLITINQGNTKKGEFTVNQNGDTTINLDAGTSITVDDSFSSTSENPVQNKILYPSLSNFIPANTTITVETDGSGDFTKLSDAISYLNGKWSNGTVTIQLGNGTFSESSIITIPYNNIPIIKIIGKGINQTTVQGQPNESARGFVYTDQTNHNSSLYISNITFEDTVGTASGATISSLGGLVILKTVKTINYARGFYRGLQNARAVFQDITVANTTNKGSGLQLQGADIFFMGYFNASNVSTGIQVSNGSTVKCDGLTYQINNVTNRYSISKGTFTSDGYIIGGITETT